MVEQEQMSEKLQSEEASNPLWRPLLQSGQLPHRFSSEPHSLSNRTNL
jgi:hypothetical protein